MVTLALALPRNGRLAMLMVVAGSFDRSILSMRTKVLLSVEIRKSSVRLAPLCENVMGSLSYPAKSLLPRWPMDTSYCAGRLIWPRTNTSIRRFSEAGVACCVCAREHPGHSATKNSRQNNRERRVWGITFSIAWGAAVPRETVILSPSMLLQVHSNFAGRRTPCPLARALQKLSWGPQQRFSVNSPKRHAWQEARGSLRQAFDRPKSLP